MDVRAQVGRWWRQHLVALFPARLREHLVAGVDAVMLDADVAGCVQAWLEGGPRSAAEPTRPLRALLVQADAVLADLRDPDEVAYVHGLRQMAAAITTAT